MALILTNINTLDYNKYIKSINNVNLLQTSEYGIAKAITDNLELNHFLIQESTSNNKIAICQFFSKNVFFITIIRINRGPLFFEELSEELKAQKTIEIFNLFKKYYFNRSFLLIFIAPEIFKSINVIKIFKRNCYIFRKIPTWSSGILNLSNPLTDILMNLDGKWRNSMRKAEKNLITVKKTQLNEKNINILLSEYSNLKIKKNFDALSLNLLNNLYRQNTINWSFNLYFAFLQNDQQNPIGQLVTIKHYDTCIYLIGITNDIGKMNQANSILLWKSIEDAKEDNCLYFDIGGLNETTPKGIANFKKGLNSNMYSLIGEFVTLRLPRKLF